MTPPVRNEDLRGPLSQHKLLADTSFMMHPNFAAFLRRYRDVFLQNRILTPAKVVQELEAIVRRGDDRRPRAEATLKIIADAQARGLVEVRGEVADDHANADQVLSRVVEQHLGHHNLLVLTNDRALKDWLWAKKQNGCYRADTSLRIVRFGPTTGHPHIWRSGDRPPRPAIRPSAPPANPPPRPSPPLPAVRIPRPRPAPPPLRPPAVPRFRVGVPLANDLTVPLKPRSELKQNDVAFAGRHNPVRLGATLGVGGEGTVYRTDRLHRVCKIYHPDRLTVGVQRKIELMASRPVAVPGLCWPEEPVYDADGTFRGFLMAEAAGEPLAAGLFHPYPWLGERPTWTRRDSVRVAVDILEKIAYLHGLGVLLGDINAGNFLVDARGKVFLVDCDSYQVEGYPCPVGHPNFVAPEIQNVKFTEFLRTEEHELFAVATLLFMIMIPGKAPYSHQGGTDVAADIRVGHFPYPLGKKGQQKAPEGVWRLCWSHLSRSIKEQFYQSFHQDHRGQRRVAVGDWLASFRDYARLLRRDENVFIGPQARYGYDLSILPKNFRCVKGGNRTPKAGPTDLDRFLEALTTKVTGGKKAAKALPPAAPPAAPIALVKAPPPPAATLSMPVPAPAKVSPPLPAAPRQLSSTPFSLFVAAYGQASHPAVQACWRFHAEILQSSAVGRLCSGVAAAISAPAAVLVRAVPGGRTIARPALAPLVWACRLLNP